MKKEFTYLFFGLVLVGVGLMLLFSNPQLSGNVISNVEDITQKEYVLIMDSEFVPKEIIISPETVVIWQNKDEIDYTLIISDGVTIKKEIAEANTEESLWFSNIGTYKITSSENSNLEGYIFVE